jgi:[acyl-carrier-protein] S-malonyltransferase
MGPLLFVFPGQGSQSVGMMRAYEGLPLIRETFVQASDALGEDLWQLVEVGPEEALMRTRNTQPVMLAAGVAVWRAWKALGGADPAWLAGHSLGEYSALVAADALDFADAVRLVRLRAEAMQEAVPEGVGAMAALLGLEAETVAEVCAAATTEAELVAPANLNAPGQIVIAGHRPAVLRAVELAKARGAKRGVLLPVSAPFHCALMRPAAERLAVALERVAIRSPRIPVIHNVDVALHPEPEAIRAALVAQAYSPVRWIETVAWAVGHGASVVAECGPGKVLAGLTKRIAKEAEGIALADAESMRSLLARQSTTEQGERG